MAKVGRPRKLKNIPAILPGIRPTDANLIHKRGPGRPKGVPNKAHFEIRNFSRNIIESPSYQRSLRQRVIAGEAPHMEPLLFAYGYGKPIERVQIVDQMQGTIERLAETYGLMPEQLLDRLRNILAKRVA